MAGQLKINNLQLGDSATATNNFVLHGFTAEDLHNLFYIKDDKLFNKIHRHASAKVDVEAGYISNQNYRLVTVEDKTFGVHRAIFLMTNGYLPEIVDHIDGDALNNKLSNLRPATKASNNHNAVIRKDNSVGVKGITFNKEAGKFTARVQAFNKRLFLGAFDTLDLAKAAIEKHRLSLHGEFANHGMRGN